jgi:hypothetical protein
VVALQVRTLREHPALRLPNPVRLLGTVRGLFRHCEATASSWKFAGNADFAGRLVVGATGIEPVTPCQGSACLTNPQNLRVSEKQVPNLTNDVPRMFTVSGSAN